MPDHQHTSLQQKVLDQINSGKLHMRPHIYFTLKVAFVAVLAVLVLGISVVLANMILFAVVASGRSLLLGFGPRGVLLFVRFFPYPLLALDIVLVVLLQFLLRRWRFGYRTPMIYSLGALVVVSAAGAFALHRGTPVERILVHHAQRDELPPVLDATQSFFFGFLKHPQRPAAPGNGLYRGTISRIATSAVLIADSHFGVPVTRNIELPPNDNMATTAGLKVGDEVFVAGDERDGVVHAFGIRAEPHEEEQEEHSGTRVPDTSKNLRSEED